MAPKNLIRRKWIWWHYKWKWWRTWY